MVENLSEADAKVQAERAKQYGDATFGHGNLGLIWTGLIQNHYGVKFDHPIPASLVLVLMAAAKANRAALPAPVQPDDYADGRIYFSLAEEARIREDLTVIVKELEKGTTP